MINFKKNKLLIISLLMLVVPEIIFLSILNFVIWLLTNDDHLNTVWLLNERNILYGIILFIQTLGIIGLIKSVFKLARERKDKHIKASLYILDFFLLLLLCFVGFIFFMLYVFANLSIGL